MPVNTPRSDFLDMTAKWRRLRDCYDGRDAVLRAAAKYVPDLQVKTPAENEAYRSRGNFFNATQRTIQGLVGAIFQEAPDVIFPDPIKSYLDDITQSNIPFEMFSQEAGREVMLAARYGVLVDMPESPDANNRPYCIGFKAESIINWRTQRINGVETLTLVVLKECVEVPKADDPFCCEDVEQYRVVKLTPVGCAVELWREKSKTSHEFVLFKNPVLLLRRGVPLPFIPFVFICAKNANAELETPPLIDLADINLGHWRNSVDYEYGLHLVALPTPWVSGSKAPGAASEPMKIGPSAVWELDVNGVAGMLEFTGKGLESIEKAMEEKKKQMSVLGSRMLEDSAAVQETASAVRMRHSGEQASLRTVAQSLEIGLTLVLQIVAWWNGADDLVSEVAASVELNKEYLNVPASAQEITAMLTALQANEISFDTWWQFLQDGGRGREGVTAADEQALADKQKEAANAAKEAIAKAGQPPVPPPPTKNVERDAQGNIVRIVG